MWLRGFESMVLAQCATVPFEVIGAEALVTFLAAKVVRWNFCFNSVSRYDLPISVLHWLQINALSS